MPIPTLQTHSIDDESRHGRDRRQALLALTQTCRTLRRVFLRYLWQRIELYDSIEIREAYGAIMAQYQPHPCCPPADWALKRHAEVLIGRLETVTIREPSLAFHVKNETWDGSTSEIFLPPSLEILHMIPFQQDPISRATPSRFFYGISSMCLTEIVKQLPNLREVSLDPTLLLLGFDQLKPLSTLQHLHTIRLALNMDPPRPGHRILYKPGQETTQAALWVRHTYSGE
ncbi:unnamed protein product [Cyclocybe aegerita]|uniref:Uncharacterized protein n=1 Tax=Cyclocybe aegerita TaxID=1973307 RepID=A0A8S0XL50_CYCAE|nr:unnamed protein product [Cyclocybe aegerita]